MKKFLYITMRQSKKYLTWFLIIGILRLQIEKNVER